MRVLYFTRGFTAHDRRFLAALAGTGHEVFYLPLEQPARDMAAGELPPRIERLAWRGAPSPADLATAAALVPDLQRLIARVRPDLVHAGPLQLVARLVALAGFRPLVAMSWGSDLLVDADRDPAWNAATRETLQHSAVLVGDCQTVRDKAVSLGFPAERIVTFPWGVDLAHFSPGDGSALRRQLGLPRESFVLLSARSWEPLYGVDVVARAFVRAARGCPRLRLIMLGSGSQEGLLRRIFSEAGVLDRVALHGQVELSDLPDCYRAADLYLSASHSDGSSVSLLEALACGCPALVSDIPSNREWVTPGAQGWRFPDGDAGALSAAVLEAVSETDRLAEMRRSARRLAESRADWSKNFPRLLEAYEKAKKIQPQTPAPAPGAGVNADERR